MPIEGFFFRFVRDTIANQSPDCYYSYHYHLLFDLIKCDKYLRNHQGLYRRILAQWRKTLSLVYLTYYLIQIK
jgi:hypothetical protein